MPVPAPATAMLLQGVPLAAVPVTGEMTTPTGAAILTTVVNEWTEQPAMTVAKIGHGAGTKDFPDWPNVLRLLVGETSQAIPGQSLEQWPNQAEQDAVCILETNLDDVSPEIIGFCIECLFAAGALDVFCAPVQMKKNRPGIVLSVIAEPAKAADLEFILLRETGTLVGPGPGAEKDILELVHAGIGEKQRRVVQRHHGRRRHEGVAVLLHKEVDELLANLRRAGHDILEEYPAENQPRMNTDKTRI